MHGMSLCLCTESIKFWRMSPVPVITPSLVMDNQRPLFIIRLEPWTTLFCFDRQASLNFVNLGYKCD